MTQEKTITITIAEYNSLLEREVWLECLEEAGVDNWDGMSFAHEILEARLLDTQGWETQ